LTYAFEISLDAILLGIRYAHNIVTWGCGALNLGGCRIGDEEITAHHAPAGTFAGGRPGRGSSRSYYTNKGRMPSNLVLNESAGALLDESTGRSVSRFFYCPKSSPEERDAGLGRRENHHPTVKPIELTQWLAKLILPPPRSTPRILLVPYCGVFSEIIGAIKAGWDEVIGIEMNRKFIEIGKARLLHWCRAA